MYLTLSECDQLSVYTSMDCLDQVVELSCHINRIQLIINNLIQLLILINALITLLNYYFHLLERILKL